MGAWVWEPVSKEEETGESLEENVLALLIIEVR